MRVLRSDQWTESSGVSAPPTSRWRPYPSQWQRHLEVKDGCRSLCADPSANEPVIMNSAARHQHDLRLRFLRTDEEFTHEFIARLTSSTMPARWPLSPFDEATNEMWAWFGSTPIRSTRPANTRSCSDPISRAGGWLGVDQVIIEYANPKVSKRSRGRSEENTGHDGNVRHLGLRSEGRSVEHGNLPREA